MRVLQVCPYDISRAGGVQRHILDLSRALAGAGHEVTVVAPFPVKGADAQYAAEMRGNETGFDLRHLGRSWAWTMQGTTFELTWASADALNKLVAHSRLGAFDVAHFHTLWTPLMPWQLFRRIEYRVRRRVATFHDTPPPGLSGFLNRGLYRFLGRRLSKRLHAMIAVSEPAGAQLEPREGCSLNRLPPCIDLQPYSSLASRQHDAPTVLFVGRLEERKGLLLLIGAFARMRAMHPDARLVICGAGEQRAAGQSLAAAKGLAAAVRFTGALGERDKLRLYAEAHVFCAPSPYGESYGLVIAEAMAAGLPVVAAANAGYRTILTGEGAAGLVMPGDVTALAQRLGEVLASPDLRRRLSAWGRSEAWRSDVRARLGDFLAVYAQG